MPSTSRVTWPLPQCLAAEAVAAERHEFVDGFVHAMAGATKRHHVIAGNTYAARRDDDVVMLATRGLTLPLAVLCEGVDAAPPAQRLRPREPDAAYF